MKKLLTIAACITFSCSAIAETVYLKDKCTEITIDNYQNFIDSKKNINIINPFDNGQCIPISYTEKDKSDLSKSDFSNNAQIFNLYKDFLDSKQTSVKMYYDKERKEVHTFFKFNIEDENEMKFSIKKQRKLLAHFDEFIFLHELMHTDHEITLGDYKLSDKESISDISAILLISSKHDLSINYTKKMMEELYKVRKKESKHDYAGPGRNGAENFDHFNKDNMKNAISFIKQLEKNNINLKVKSFSEARNIAKKIVKNKEHTIDFNTI